MATGLPKPSRRRFLRRGLASPGSRLLISPEKTSGLCSLLCNAESAQIRVCTDRRRKQDRWNGHSDLPYPDTDTPTPGHTTSLRKSSLQTHSISSQTIPASVIQLFGLGTTWVVGHLVFKAKAVGAGFVRASPVG